MVSLSREILELVIFPFHDWKKSEREGFRTRDGHLIQHFERDPRVGKMLIVDRPVSFPEFLLLKGRWRATSGKPIKNGLFTSLRQMSQKVFVLDLFVGDLIKPIIFRRDWWDLIFRDEKVVGAIRSSLQHLAFKTPVLFLWAPLSTGPIGKLGEKLLVFDGLDNWAEHPEMKDKRGYITKGYGEIKEKADLIFANSIALKEYLSNSRVEAVFIPNGVDMDTFTSQEAKGIPEDLKDIPRPIVGYGGKLAKRIDVDLVHYLAKNMPEVHFVFIGQVINKKWVQRLFTLPNIHYLGDKQYSQYPQYVANFDVCIIPHNVGALENDGDPMKLYEYLACGKPVVTTDIAGVRAFEDVITIASTNEEFLGGIRRYLELIKDGANLAEGLREALSPSCTWEYKARYMIDLITEKIALKRGNSP